MTEPQRRQLVEGARSFGLELDERTVQRFAQFAERLEEGNRQLNLTRIAPEDIVPLHFLDSLTAAAFLPFSSGGRLLDVGTGAGFPGLPLALAFPELRVTLLDGTRKRLVFLEGVITQLGLTNVETRHGRAEALGRDPGHRANYDFVTARAVAKMLVLAAWLLPLVRPGGVAIAYKSRDIEAEVAQTAPVIAKLGGKVERIAEVTLPGTDILRKLVLLRKASSGRG